MSKSDFRLAIERIFGKSAVLKYLVTQFNDLIRNEQPNIPPFCKLPGL